MNYEYNAKVVRVVDGDTVILVVDLGLRLFHEISARMEGINAPERYAVGGRESTAHLQTLLPVGQQVRIETYKNPTDKYGRWLVKIFVDLKNINLAMIADGHAVAML